MSLTFRELTRPDRTPPTTIADLDDFLADHNVNEVFSAAGSAHGIWTLLDKFVENGQLPLVRHLLEQGANVHKGQDYALRVAAEIGRLPVVQCLVEHGADVHANSNEALQLAIDEGRLETAEYLQSVMPVIDTMTELGITYEADSQNYQTVLRTPELWSAILTGVIISSDFIQRLASDTTASSKPQII